MHPLDTVKVLFKLEGVLVLEFIPTADALHKCLQLQDLSGRPLLQDQIQVSSMCEAQLRQIMLVGLLLQKTIE